MTRHVLHEFMTGQLDQPASCRHHLARDIFLSIALTMVHHRDGSPLTTLSEIFRGSFSHATNVRQARKTVRVRTTFLSRAARRTAAIWIEKPFLPPNFLWRALAGALPISEAVMVIDRRVTNDRHFASGRVGKTTFKAGARQFPATFSQREGLCEVRRDT
jgi:hypothetical protein